MDDEGAHLQDAAAAGNVYGICARTGDVSREIDCLSAAGPSLLDDAGTNEVCVGGEILGRRGKRLVYTFGLIETSNVTNRKER